MENREENERKYVCDKCHYKCSYNCDFEKHLMTVKHKRRIATNAKSNKLEKLYNCECGKTYKHLSSLCKHKNMCSQIYNSKAVPYASCNNRNEKPSMIDIITQNKEIMDMLVLQNEELKRQNKEQNEELKRQNKEQYEELKRQNKEQSDTIRELMPKIGNNNGSNNTTNNTQFNLQVFLNEDCKDALNFSEFIETIKVSFADLENQAENGYIKGISKLFIENLQSLGINKRPIHCTDKKRKTLYIKQNDAWDKEGSQDALKKGIQEVSRRTFEELIKSKEVNAEEYKDNESEFSNKCVSIQRNLVPTYPRETTISKVIENITQQTGILEKS
jgi:hypothetical protein